MKEGKDQHGCGDAQKLHAAAGGSDKKAQAVVGIALTCHICKGNTAQDTDPPCGGGQYPGKCVRFGAAVKELEAEQGEQTYQVIG